MKSERASAPTMMNAADRSRLLFRGTPRATLATLALLATVLAMPVAGAVTFAPGLAPAVAAPMAPAAGHAATAAPPPGALHITGSLEAQLAQRLSIANSPALDHAMPLKFLGGGHGFAPIITPSARGSTSAGPGSDADNFYVSGSDCSGWYGGNLFVPWVSGSSIAQVGGSNQTLLAAGGSFNNVFNNTTAGNSQCTSGIYYPSTLLYGLATVYRTADAGQQWTSYAVPPNATLWDNVNSSVTNSSFSTGNEYIAAAPNGDASVITGYAPQCVVFGVTCGGLHGVYGPWGFAISSSHNGGVTWSNASQVSGVNGLNWLAPSSTCSALGVTAQLYVNNIPEDPWIVMNNSIIVAGWDVLHQQWNNTACGFNVNAVVQMTVSTDGGATFSTPKNVTNVVTDGISVALSPASAHTIYLVAVDSGNFSSSANTIFFSFQKSTNGGTTWSTESDITTDTVHLTSTAASAPDVFSTLQRPVLAVDNWTASPHSGNLYLVWQDNDTGSNQGYPTIAFAKSTNGGTTWSAPTYLTGQSNKFSYVEPDISVGPTGTVWVNYYGINQSSGASGAYNVFGVASTDGGTTWTPQFRVSDMNSNPGTTPGAGASVLDLGFYMATAATSGGEVPIWSDCRNVQCGTGFDVQHFTAIVELVNFSSTAPTNSSPSALITTDGTVTSYSLPTNQGWEWGSTHQIRVPETLPYNSTDVEAFTGLSGLSTSTSVSSSVTVSQLGVNLVAHYAPTPATFIEGSITPLVAGVQLQLDSIPVPISSNATAYTYVVVVPQNGQSHWLNVTAPNYQPDDQIVATNAAGITYQNFTLSRDHGTIKITVSASQGFSAYLSQILNASVQVNGTSETLFNGGVSVSEPFGTYDVTAMVTGFAGAASHPNPITVTANQVTSVSFSFTGGWINGTFVPAVSGDVLEVDHVAVTVNNVGGFSAGVPGGFHNLTATASGYNLSTIHNIGVVPLATHFVNVTLTNHGWLSGQVQPAGALSTVFVRITQGSSVLIPTVSKTTGSFNESLPAGTWTVTTSATNYNNNVTTVHVSAGNGSTYFPTLTAVTCVSNCNNNGSNNHHNNTNGTSTPSSSGISTLDIALIAVAIIVVVAVIVVVMMMRRGGGGGGDADYAPQPAQPEQPLYGESAPDMQKLQPDGSMGPGGSPPGSQ